MPTPTRILMTLLVTQALSSPALAASYTAGEEQSSVSLLGKAVLARDATPFMFGFGTTSPLRFGAAYLGGQAFFTTSAQGAASMGYGGITLGSAFMTGPQSLFDAKVLFGGGNIANTGNAGFLLEPSLGYALQVGNLNLGVNLGYVFIPANPAAGAATLGVRFDFFAL
ncbi:MAG: hypothetical protein VKP72_03165 [bacterium]|nr:hypothetical protein [bacterium]